MMLWDFTHDDNSFITIKKKGYPKLFDDATFIVMWDDKTHIPLGYCCYKDMGNYLLVGNVYVHPLYRGEGLFTSLRGFRCKIIKSLKKPTIGIMQPLEGVDASHLVQHITQTDADIVRSYEDVKDVISKDVYYSINSHMLVRYREDFYDEKKTRE